MISRYHIITKEHEVNLLIKACKKTKICSFDFETNSLDLYRTSFYPTILSVTYQPGLSIILPLNHFESPFRDDGGNGKWRELLVKFGRGVIENPEITKVAWNHKFDQRIMGLYGIYNEGVVLDGMLAKYLLDEEKPHGLKEAVTRYLPEFSNYEKENNIDKLAWDKKPLEALSKYAGIDSDATLRLTLFFERKLQKLKLYDLYRNLIMMASKVLIGVESHGLLIDQEMNDDLYIRYTELIEITKNKLLSMKQIKKFEKWMMNTRREKYISSIENEIEELEKKIRSLKKGPHKTLKGRLMKSIGTRKEKISRVRAGELTTKKELEILAPINFGSQQQMVQLLYLSPKGFKFPVIEYTKDKNKKQTKNPSTAEDIIKQLREHDKHGFIDTLLELRGYEHICSTFIVGWKERIQDDGRLHPSFLLHGTVTGRLSSKNPNFQQVPKMEVNKDIKPQILPSPGKLFFMYDYSQAELRILAHLAKEKTMIEWFRDGKDIHLASACKKYGENYDEILKIYENENHPRYKEWKIKRKQAKQINFGVVYEQTAMKLAEGLSDRDNNIIVSTDEAQVFLDDFFRLFPKIKKFVDKQHSRMEKKGYVKSLFGRRRRCPEVFGESYQRYLEALRQCVDGETQALTKSGWKSYKELWVGEMILTKNIENGCLEWQPIEQLNIYPNSGDLYELRGKTFSAVTNGKHRWLCNHNTKPNSNLEWNTTEQLFKDKIIRPIHRTGSYYKVNTVYPDDLVRFIGLILTDGSLRYYNTPGKPRNGLPWYAEIFQSKEKNIPVIDDLCKRLGYPFTRKIRDNGGIIWKFPKEIAELLHSIIPKKELNMEFILGISSDQVLLLLEYMKIGDGCKKGARIVTSDKRQADLIQILNILSNNYSNILEIDYRGAHHTDKCKSGKIITRKKSWLVTTGVNQNWHHRSTRGINHITKLEGETRLIWCPTVKNGTWVCRRENKTYITGNSTNFPCQSAASDMALFASILTWRDMVKGKLPVMPEVNTVHDSVYREAWPDDITKDTVYKIWDICRNPQTKKYFGFQVDDVDMSMDFSVGRHMGEELPYIPGYNYSKMLDPDFSREAYIEEYKKVKNIPIKEYPKLKL